MPRCKRGSCILSNVASLPPCIEPDAVKTEAGLFSNEPFNQRGDADSRKNFNEADIFPNCVGLPKINPSQFSRSDKLAYISP